MEMPSETVMVLNGTLLAPASSAPIAAASASSLMCMLQGVTMLQVEAMPTWGLSKSAPVKPTARSMARLGAWATPSTTIEECGRWSFIGAASLLIALGWLGRVLSDPGGERLPAAAQVNALTSTLAPRA